MYEPPLINLVFNFTRGYFTKISSRCMRKFKAILNIRHLCRDKDEFNEKLKQCKPMSGSAAVVNVTFGTFSSGMKFTCCY